MLPEVVCISPKTLAYFGDNEKVENEFNDYKKSGEKIQFGGSNRMPNPINGRQIIKVEIHGEETTAAIESEVTYFTQEQDENLYSQKLDLLKSYLT